MVVKKEYGSEKGFISVLELIKAIGGLEVKVQWDRIWGRQNKTLCPPPHY